MSGNTIRRTDVLEFAEMIHEPELHRCGTCKHYGNCSICYECSEGSRYSFEWKRYYKQHKMKFLSIYAPKKIKSRWIKEEGGLLVYRCPFCKSYIYPGAKISRDERFEELFRTNAYKFCPRCGEDMLSLVANV